MRPSNKFSKTIAATAGLATTAGLAVAAVCATPASAGTQVTPAGDSVTGTLVGNLVVNVGSFQGTCTISSVSGKIPASPSNVSDGAITVPLGTPTVSNCSINAPLENLTVQVSGNWAITGQYGSPINGYLTIPQNGVYASISGLVSCTGNAAPAGAVTLPGIWTNGTDSVNNPSKVSVVNGTVPVAVSGGGLCPGNTGFASVSATYAVKDTTNPSAPVVIGPYDSTPTTTTTPPSCTTTTTAPPTTTTVPPTTTTAPTTTVVPPTTTTSSGGGTGSAGSLPFLGPLFGSLSGGSAPAAAGPMLTGSCTTSTTTVPTTTVPPTTTTIPTTIQTYPTMTRGSLS
ncbi:hypothetical protein [Nocardia stercoris]|uniref:Ig-like domain repeat protein n=1 Tax=Nocardia stercoris TaxID=2483361 RepID=A0A3M2L335_9NOCA|nr:hypothetical protein [Nocardia stercoris]RMI32129.1 hypothetical protein EBN03_14025 [Nocardia stercoris]